MPNKSIICAFFAVVTFISHLSHAADCSPISASGKPETVGIVVNSISQSIDWNIQACPMQGGWYYFVSDTSEFKAWLQPTDVAIPIPVRQPFIISQVTPLSQGGGILSDYKSWLVYEDKEHLKLKGTLPLNVSSIKTANKLRVIQNIAGVYNSFYYDSATLSASDNESGSGIAVTTPGIDQYAVSNIHNAASFLIPDFLRNKVSTWQIFDISWGSEFIPQSIDVSKPAWRCLEEYQQKKSPNKPDCPIDALREIRFLVRNPRSDALTLKLRGLDSNGLQVIETTSVRVATAARQESMAIPLRLVAFVRCRYKYSILDVVNGTTVGIYDKDLELQICSFVLAHRSNREKSPYPKLDQSLLSSYFENVPSYGKQRIELKIVQAGETISEEILVYDPSGESNEWPLIIRDPKKIRDASAIYEVHARIMTETTQVNPAGSGEIVYRNGPTATTDQSFLARLRPTGLFALPRNGNLRIFVTLPVDITAIRAPGSARDLRGSSQDPSVQVTPLKVGLLLGFEPWDYDRGKHLWPIPVRFLLGWHAVDLINTYFSPSLLAGASVTLPLIESPSQLNTSLALGAFYGFDLREAPISASHFLLTLGFNFFSLFGAKSK